MHTAHFIRTSNKYVVRNNGGTQNLVTYKRDNSNNACTNVGGNEINSNNTDSNNGSNIVDNIGNSNCGNDDDINGNSGVVGNGDGTVGGNVSGGSVNSAGLPLQSNTSQGACTCTPIIKSPAFIALLAVIALLIVILIGVLFLWKKERRLREKRMAMDEAEVEEKLSSLTATPGSPGQSALKIQTEAELQDLESLTRRNASIARRVDELEAQRQPGPTCVLFKFGLC
ncbi:hypothetical protein MVEN_01324400 [Mycena venus]|uniref:Uncharacterized protein n=1 Tax=Mycena venus TaxID=2733690 RepID=A0A8H6XZ08_9AGAR|nr:hypothetical protein MVEN_01324400 [Mycena venus]